jgi:positive regulator of sigma E activity
VKQVQNIIQGVRINLDQVSDPQGQVTACLVNSLAGDVEACSSAHLRKIDNQNSLMILLPHDYSIQPGENVILELKFDSPVQGRIDPQPGNLMLNGIAIGSAIDASLLYSFDLQIAFQTLIVRNVFGDGILVMIWLAIVICLLAYLVWFLRRLLCDSV